MGVTSPYSGKAHARRAPHPHAAFLALSWNRLRHDHAGSGAVGTPKPAWLLAIVEARGRVS